MKTYSITYDLGNPNRDYDNVTEAIKSLSHGYCRPTESHWFINSNATASEIRDTVGNVMDSDDKLMVNEVGDTWASLGLRKATNDWLKKHWRSACRV